MEKKSIPDQLRDDSQTVKDIWEKWEKELTVDEGDNSIAKQMIDKLKSAQIEMRYLAHYIAKGGDG